VSAGDPGVVREDPLARRRRERARLLRLVYDRSDADVATFLDAFELADELGIEHHEVGRLVRYFEERGLLKHLGGGGLMIRITAEGIDEIERLPLPAGD
jgi:hypothetical protein